MLADLDGSHDDQETSADKRTAFVGELNGGVLIESTGGTAADAAEMIAVFEGFLDAEFQKDIAARDATFGTHAPELLLPRTDAQRRFDAVKCIFDAAAGAVDAGIAPRVSGSNTVVNIVVDLHTFEDAMMRAGWMHPDATTPAAPDLADRRSETSTGVPVPPLEALQAAVAGRVRRLVLDDCGVIVNQGRKQRLFSGAIRDTIKLLAAHCGHPGCTVPGRCCQIDHVEEWISGGHTDGDNADIDCGVHNRLKHHGYQVRRHRRGRTWIRPDGTPMTAAGQRPIPETDRLDAITHRRLDELVRERRQRSHRDQNLETQNLETQNLETQNIVVSAS
jgi:hypothetical protein